MAQNAAPLSQIPRMPMPPRPLMQQGLDPIVSSPAISETQHQMLPLMSEIHQPRPFLPQPINSQPAPLMGQHILLPAQRPPPHVNPNQMPPQPMGQIQIQPMQIQGHEINQMPPLPPGHDVSQMPPQLQPPGPHHPLLPHQMPQGPPPHLSVLPGHPPQPPGPPPHSMYPGTMPPGPPPPGMFPGPPRQPFPPISDSFPPHHGMPRPLFSQAPPPPGQPPMMITAMQRQPTPYQPIYQEEQYDDPDEYDPSEPTSPTGEKLESKNRNHKDYGRSRNHDSDSDNSDEYGTSMKSDNFYDDYGNPIQTEETEFDDYGNPIKVKREPVDEYDPSVPTEADSPEKLSFQVKKEHGSPAKKHFVKEEATGDASRSSVKKMSNVFELPDDSGDTEETKETVVFPPQDPATKATIERLAADVAQEGPEVEAKIFCMNRNNPEYWFLYEQESEAYKYYRYRVSQLTGKSTENKKDDLKKDSKGKKRKSRWGAEDDIVPPILSAVPTKHAPTVTIEDFARRMVGSSELSDEQLKQIREQQEMNMMYQLIMAQKKAKEAAMMSSAPGMKASQKYEYDSDEDDEGGTWEHKQRTAEMVATKEWADKLTESNKGKHFIGDFLPPDELERFMETYKALKEGRQPDYSDYKEFKLTCENVGYKMLEKLGWKEGEGLGQDGQGITAPVNKGSVSVEGRGLGIERPSALDADDDEFDAYRKRMMLAYRFRPNPLNNPRRPYY